MLGGQVLINNTDIWTTYKAFLREEKRGSHENQNAIFARAAMKKNVAVNIREENGEKYSDDLMPKHEGRDVVLHFAISASSVAEFIQRYTSFATFLETGNKGWLTFSFPGIGVTLKMFLVEYIDFSAISNLWVESEQAGAFKIKFRDPGRD